MPLSTAAIYPSLSRSLLMLKAVLVVTELFLTLMSMRIVLFLVKQLPDARCNRTRYE